MLSVVKPIESLAPRDAWSAFCRHNRELCAWNDPIAMLFCIWMFIHVRNKDNLLPNPKTLRVNGVAHIVQKLLALSLYDEPLVVVTQDHDAVIGAVEGGRGFAVNGG